MGKVVPRVATKFLARARSSCDPRPMTLTVWLLARAGVRLERLTSMAGRMLRLAAAGAGSTDRPAGAVVVAAAGPGYATAVVGASGAAAGEAAPGSVLVAPLQTAGVSPAAARAGGGFGCWVVRAREPTSCREGFTPPWRPAAVVPAGPRTCLRPTATATVGRPAACGRCMASRAGVNDAPGTAPAGQDLVSLSRDRPTSGSVADGAPSLDGRLSPREAA